MYYILLFTRVRIPTPGPGMSHPKYPTTMFFAKISPNPNITPFTNGNKRLMARDDANASMRARLESELLNIARVTDEGFGGGRYGGSSGCS